MLTQRDLETRFGPVLSDGTPLSELFDFERREIAMRVLNDPEIHQLELKKIFAEAWVVVGHVAEIPNAGDYVSRYIGNDGVLVTRGDDGEISILLNVCSHRGMQVCRAEEGNAGLFVCPYHGWAFDTAGKLLGAPQEKEMYGDWDKSSYGLVKAKVEVLHGIIYGTFAEHGPTLDEYLGEFKWYLDFDLGEMNPDDYEVGGPSQRFQVAANWKTLAEQFAGDAYHANHLHRAQLELDPPAPGSVYHGPVFCNVGTKEGHCLLSWDYGQRYMGIPPEIPFDINAVGRVFPALIFPASNISLGGGRGRVDEGNVMRFGTGISIGGIIPKGPGSYELWRVPIVHKSLDEEARERQRLSGYRGDMIFADDAQQGPSMQRSAEGVVARSRMKLKYNSTHGGPNRPSEEAWPGPGDVYAGYGKDDSQWQWWSHWYDVLTTE
jgi:nitrite reductase/ring-hydroxylating ferredoxin subunit